MRGGGLVRVSVWVLLGWFGHQNRGVNVNAGIARVLKECGLKTHPDFEAGDAYETLEFRRAPSQKENDEA